MLSSYGCQYEMDNPLFDWVAHQPKRLEECNSRNTKIVYTFKFSDALKCSGVLAVPFVTILSGQSLYDYSSSLPMGIVGATTGGVVYSVLLGAILFPRECMAGYKASSFSYDSRVKRMQQNR